MTKKVTRLWVSPEFKNKIKLEAYLRGRSILQFTDDIANSRISIEEFLRPKEKKPTRGFLDNVF